jgi:hypothetical protein
MLKKCEKQNSHPNVHGTFVPKNFTVTHFTSNQNHVSSLNITTLRITSLNYTQSPLEFPCL